MIKCKFSPELISGKFVQHNFGDQLEVPWRIHQRNAHAARVRWSTRNYLQNSQIQSFYSTGSMIEYKFPAELFSATSQLHRFGVIHINYSISISIWITFLGKLNKSISSKNFLVSLCSISIWNFSCLLSAVHQFSPPSTKLRQLSHCYHTNIFTFYNDITVTKVKAFQRSVKVVYHFTNLKYLTLVLLQFQQFECPPYYYYYWRQEIIKHTVQGLPLIPWRTYTIFRESLSRD